MVQAAVYTVPHSLIVGTTLSGKTQLAKALSNEYAQKGVPSLVLDPLRSRWDNAAFQTTDPDKFSDVVRKSTRCAVFVDESGNIMGRWDTTLQWLATEARHFGHRSHFISQRPALLNLTVRDQCEHIFIFRVSQKDAKMLAEEFVNDDLLDAAKLPKLHFIWVQRFGETKRGRIDFQNGQPVVVYLTGETKYGSDNRGGGSPTRGGALGKSQTVEIPGKPAPGGAENE